MKRKIGNSFMIMGAVLVGIALSLFLYNQWDAKRAEKCAARIMYQMEQKMEASDKEKNDGDEMTQEDAKKKTETEIEEEKEKNRERKEDPSGQKVLSARKKMQTIQMEGDEYIGYLSIPAISLTLPVMESWSEEGLKRAPGRFSGSVYTDDLVIAGHNYRRHFSPIKWLEPGTEVDFTDVERHVWQYRIVETVELAPTQVDEMISKTEESKWDLTLFTCTTSGAGRCAVRCSRVE